MRLKEENEILQNCLAQEKQKVSTLEKLLSEMRSEQAGHQTSVSELQEVIGGLKATIRCLQESL
jgi:predicted RNase H-like nuclease (RuvC/YqgF family)